MLTVKKLITLLLIVFFIVGCAGPTRLTYKELPKDRPLAMKINDVTFRVISFGYTKDWSELEIAVANEADEEIDFNPSQVFLTNEKGYDLIPLRTYEINERVHRKTGKWINPLTVGAIAAGITAIVAPSSKDRTAFARAALALVGVAAATEVAKRQSAKADIQRKEDLLLKRAIRYHHIYSSGAFSIIAPQRV